MAEIEKRCLLLRRRLAKIEATEKPMFQSVDTSDQGQATTLHYIVLSPVEVEVAVETCPEDMKRVRSVRRATWLLKSVLAEPVRSCTPTSQTI